VGYEVSESLGLYWMKLMTNLTKIRIELHLQLGNANEIDGELVEK
jgi:hypothetical protein